MRNSWRHFRKGENTDNQHFLLFPSYFLLCEGQTSLFDPTSICRLQILLIWTSLKLNGAVESVNRLPP